MGLHKKAGKIRLSRSGKALEIVEEVRGSEYRFYAPIVLVKRVLEGKLSECDMALLVADSRRNY